MKHLLTLMALIISSSGVIVSLAREEVRCYLGLEAHPCSSSPAQLAPLPTVTPTPTPTPLVRNQPPEVIPTPENTESISIPLEVIPPPEE